MSGKLTLDTEAGGSVTIIVDDTETADIEYPLDSAGIESGGDDTIGHYTKFPDGTLICWQRYFQPAAIDTKPNGFGTTSGDIYRGESYVTFPHEFIAAPSVVVSPTSYDCQSAIGRDATTSNFRVNVFYLSGSDRAVSWQAIGRWK